MNDTDITATAYRARQLASEANLRDLYNATRPSARRHTCDEGRGDCALCDEPLR